MKKIMLVLAIALMFLLSPSINRSDETVPSDEEYVLTLTNKELIQEYCLTMPIKRLRPEYNQAVFKELERRKVFPLEEKQDILSHTIRIGMSEIGMILAVAKVYYHINESVGSWGVHKQYVFEDNFYVYTKNGKVTSWQQRR